MTKAAGSAVGTAVNTASVAVARPPAVARSAARTPGSRPELLDRLPKPFITSPPMMAVGGVFVLLYGMVMLGVVTNLKNRPDPVPPPQKAYQPYALIGPEPNKQEQDPAKKAEPLAGKSAESDAKKPDPKKESSEKPKPPVTAERSPKDNVSPKTENEKKDLLVKNDHPAPTTSASKAEFALNTTAVAPTNTTPAALKAETWGLLSGSTGDSAFVPEGAGLTLNIPGTFHVLNPGLGTMNAPYLLTEAGGNFTAQVQVVGKIQPGNVPLDMPVPGPKPKDKKAIPKFPFTFQGAGLLIWQDPKNFIRFERTSTFLMETGKRAHVVLFEYWRNGVIVSEEPRPVRSLDSDLTLKFERDGSDIRCSYSPDSGKNWVPVKRLQNLPLPEAIQVGVSASNISTKPFPARFENFELSATDKRGK